MCFLKLTKEKIHIQRNTKPAARKTQIVRQEEKKTYTHDTHSSGKAKREGMCVRETKAIIGKAPRLGIRTPYNHLGVSRVNVL